MSLTSIGLGDSKESGKGPGIIEKLKNLMRNLIREIDDFCILDKTNNNLDSLIHESLLILRDRPTLNQQNSPIPLYLFKSPWTLYLFKYLV